jgi:hypothetical protein
MNSLLLRAKSPLGRVKNVGRAPHGGPTIFTGLLPNITVMKP